MAITAFSAGFALGLAPHGWQPWAWLGAAVLIGNMLRIYFRATRADGRRSE